MENYSDYSHQLQTARLRTREGNDGQRQQRNDGDNPWSTNPINVCPNSALGIGGAETGIIFPLNEIITHTKSVMYPPEPKDKPPTLRDKPDGCRTVFVGGLPEKTTEEIIREIFERCGEISVIRMSEENYCHVRFTEECHVDKAVYLSGYKLKIENKDDAAYCKRVHVDFACARDDLYEYEWRQWIRQRDALRKEMEEEAHQK